ncbi:MAG TPA: CRTAC1 family protein, partial [Thermoanaerobaculia bacterium]|nr:CRTAC1 family protein [Thermoanaerobaculia bacterium]
AFATALLAFWATALAAGEPRPARWSAQAPHPSGSSPAPPAPGPRHGPRSPVPAAGDAGPLFLDATGTSGIDFAHRGERTGSLLLPEITGSGLALLDFDRDGDLDLFLVQSGELDPAANRRAGLGDRLYRNLGPSDAGAGPGDPSPDLPGPHESGVRFRDATGEAGLASFGFGMGVAAGDYDNDGWTDLYVANLGPNALLRNEGGRFREVTAGAGADDPRWSVAASFVDLDGDGWLDLYVVNYLTWSPERAVECYAPSTRRDYCGPTAYPPAADRLLRNRGDGTFEPVATGLFESAPGPGLGVVAADLDGDRRTDVYVANDGAANQLWLQRDGLRFEDQALLAGVALNRAGVPEAGMGIALTDLDHDGALDLLVTHLTGETNTFYRNRGDGMFDDETLARGLGPPSLAVTSFGTDWLDADGDGLLDLVVANGAVRLQEPDGGLGQPNQLFLQRADGRFADASARMPASFLARETSRGLAVGDLDNDGDLDFVVSNNSGAPRIYLRAGSAERSVALRLLTAAPGADTSTARDALGATVELRFADGRRLTGRAHSDGSYASARDPRVLVALPTGLSARTLRQLTVAWPDGTTETWTGERLATLLATAAADRLGSFTYTTVSRGRGEP